MVMFWSP
jgi:hypothetical protein